jgi:DNA-binding NtrC family response regulator
MSESPPSASASPDAPSSGDAPEDDAPVEVLVVEDEAIVAMELEQRLQSLGYRVAGPFDRGEDAVARAREAPPGLVLMDIHLAGDMDGIEAAEEIRTATGRPVVFLTAYSDDETLRRAKETSPFGYVVKPFEERDLYAAIEVALAKYDLEERLRRQRRDLRRLLDGLRLGTALVDADGTVLFLNEAARDLLAAAPGRPWREVFPFADDDLDDLARQSDAPPDEREKLQLRLAPGDQKTDDHALVVEVEVRNDPRDDERRIFAFYDVTEVHALRRRLGEEARYHDLIGRSESMQEVFRQTRQMAAVRSTALIVGETGTGKELVARALHEDGPRADGPFVVVNCAALTEDLAASRLFGHVKGAFTGASTDREGYFEAADGGTLFLDEIGDVPRAVQVNLLRVLEVRSITRVGETEPRAVNVRVVAATHRDLEAEVEAGRFRRDLLYRLRVARVDLPPLRARRTDLPLLVPALLAEARAATGKETPQNVSTGAMRLLLAHRWPGNVRELKNALEYGVIRAEGTALQPGDLPPELHSTDGASDESAQALDAPSEDRLDGDEEDRVRAALDAAGGNRTEAAELLGVSRATLYRRLDEFGIE